MDYNFTDPDMSWNNLPFDQENYSSTLCILNQNMSLQFDRLHDDNVKLIAFFGLILFLLFVNVAIEVVRYLRTRHLEGKED